MCIHTCVHTHAHTHLHTHRISYPERECCIGFSSGSAAPPKLWSDERRRAVSIGPERGVVKRVLCVCVSGGAEPVVCLPDAGLPARRGAKGQRGKGGGAERGGHRVVAVALWLHRNPLAPQWRMYSTYTHPNTHACTHNASTSLLLLMRAVRE